MSFHPAFYIAAKVHARQAMRAKGVSFLDSIEKVADVTPEAVDAVVTTENVAIPDTLQAPTAGAVAAASGILAAILAFFSSGLGQQLITALLALLGIA